MTVGDDAGTDEELFKHFLFSDELRATLDSFAALMRRMGVRHGPRDAGAFSGSGRSGVYDALRRRFGGEAMALWRSLDKRRAGEEYGAGSHAQGLQALVVGGGPCGLRLAIELALLGTCIHVVEARDYVSRNNILHLWPFVIQDIKLLGGKTIYPKFCTGGLDHISTRRLQLVLMKVALLLGVHVHSPVTFQGVTEPDPATGHGWRARLLPSTCPAADLDFELIVGAAGKTGGAAFPDFTRKQFRAKLAIAVTANFVNKHTPAELQVRELGGLFYVYDQEFFNNLRQRCNVKLENLVYYKGDTHYFVMTVKKESLLAKGVLKQDHADSAQLLSPSNCDSAKLREFSREVAMVTTKNQLPELEFARNHHGNEDVAVFDFTSMGMADYSCYVKRRRGRTLLQCIVGDTLLEPFWPAGTGVARGFLGVMDTAWLVRCWRLGELPLQTLVGEREAVFQILSQTKADNLTKATSKYTIDPLTRYGMRLRTKTMVGMHKVGRLFDDDGEPSVDRPPPAVDRKPVAGGTPEKSKKPPGPVKSPRHEPRPSAGEPAVAQKRATFAETREEQRAMGRAEQEAKMKGHSLDTRSLLAWFQQQLAPFSTGGAPRVSVSDLHDSWRDGLALCALLSRFRPHALSLEVVAEADAATRVQVALMVAEELGVEPLLSADDIAGTAPLDRLAMLSYLAQLQETLAAQPPPKMPRLSVAGSGPVDSAPASSAASPGRPEQPGAQAREEVSSPTSVKAMLKKLTSLSTLQSIEESAKKSQALSHNDTSAIVMDESQEIMDAILKSTRTPSTLSRKKAMFKRTPPAVVRYRESQVNLGAEQGADHASVASQGRKLPVPPPRPKAPVSGGQCVVCGLPLSLVERTTAHGVFFHRTCFRCATCHEHLHVGNSVFQKTAGQVRFYCYEHAYTAGAVDVQFADDKRKGSDTTDHSPREGATGAAAIEAQPVTVRGQSHLPSESSSSSEEEEEEEIEENIYETLSIPGSENDEILSDISLVTLPKKPNKATLQNMLRSQRSMRLLVADEVQRGLEDVETQKAELECEGTGMESLLRTQLDKYKSEELLGKWMDVLRRKKELVDREAKYMLKKKLVELQQRHQRLQIELTMATYGEDDNNVNELVEKLAEDTEALEDEMECLITQMASLTTHLQRYHGGSTSA